MSWPVRYPVFAYLQPGVSPSMEVARRTTHIMTTLATSSGSPRRPSGIVDAIANPGSLLARSDSIACADAEGSALSPVDWASARDRAAGTMPVDPIMAGETCGRRRLRERWQGLGAGAYNVDGDVVRSQDGRQIETHRTGLLSRVWLPTESEDVRYCAFRGSVVTSIHSPSVG